MILRIQSSRTAILVAACALATISLSRTSIAAADDSAVGEYAPSASTADDIETTAFGAYSTTFAGAIPTDNTHVTVYTVGRADAFMSYAQSVATAAAVTLTEVSVPRSYADLMATTDTISANVDSLATRGFNMNNWGPDIVNNTVSVVLAPAPQPQPDPNIYVQDSQTNIDSLIGPGKAVVSSTIQVLAQPGVGRDTSSAPPFTGGDGVDLHDSGGTHPCTDSWPVKRTSDGHVGLLTAGHCLGSYGSEQGDFGYLIGNVNGKHLRNGQDDFEFIRVAQTSAIWSGDHTGSTAFHLIHGYRFAAVGTLVATDGDVTKESVAAGVIKTHACVRLSPATGGDYTVCGMTYLSSSNPICQHGDSGGPVYHRLPSGYADAAGIIIGVFDNHKLCWVEGLGHIFDDSDLILDF